MLLLLYYVIFIIIIIIIIIIVIIIILIIISVQPASPLSPKEKAKTYLYGLLCEDHVLLVLLSLVNGEVIAK